VQKAVDNAGMRTVVVVLVVASLSSLALAKRTKKRAAKPADTAVTYVEDEPMAPAAAQGTYRADPTALNGARMDAAIRAPEVGRVAVTGEAVTRAPSSSLPEAVPDEGPAAGDALDEMQARQVERMMRKNQASIDDCVAAAVRRRPGASGSVTLAVVVADRKVQSVHVASDTARDVDLDACLVKAGQSWKLQLASARFSWPVLLAPSAAR
jgi:hypothetical protein